MEMRLNFSIPYYPHIDSQSEKTTPTLKNMLRACITSWRSSQCICHLENSFTTIIIKLLLRQHHMRHLMGGNADRQFTGTKLEDGKFQGHKSLNKQLEQLRRSEKETGQHQIDRSLMPITDRRIYSLRLVTKCFLKQRQ